MKKSHWRIKGFKLFKMFFLLPYVEVSWGCGFAALYIGWLFWAVDLTWDYGYDHDY